MTLTEILQILGVALAVGAGAAILIGNVFYVIRSKSSKIKDEDIVELKKQSEVNHKALQSCKSDHRVSQRDIHRLQGQIEILKDIPLKDINQDISSIRVTNRQILESLHKTAGIAAEDREVLTHPESNIDTQNVEKQNVKTVARKLKEA